MLRSLGSSFKQFLSYGENQRINVLPDIKMLEIMHVLPWHTKMLEIIHVLPWHTQMLEMIHVLHWHTQMLEMIHVLPWHTNDEGVSPGCTLAVTKTTLLVSSGTRLSGWVMVIRSRRLCCWKTKQENVQNRKCTKQENAQNSKCTKQENALWFI